MNYSNPTALRELLERPRYEIIPMRGALDEVRKLPAGTVVTVTCSPTNGVKPTIDLALKIAALGYIAVPHLAARRFASRAHLEETVERLNAAGIQDVFVIGGDGTSQSHAFNRGADLIAALAEIKPDIRSVGIPCYPEGHSLISAQLLDEALDEKCFFAGHMVTQLCFDTRVIRTWLARIRARGVALPVYIGIPGVVARHKLLGIAMRIGLGDSTRFLSKNTGLVGRLAGPSSYTPDPLMAGLSDMLGEPDLAIAGLHINAFNQVGTSEAWRKRWLAELAEHGESEPVALQSARG